MNNRVPIWVYLGLFLGAVGVWLGAQALRPDSVAQDTAKGLGYSHIAVHDRSAALPFSKCGKGDVVQWKVSGINPAGQPTEFTVCAGLFKGGTPRF